MRPFRILKNHRYFESQEKDEKVILITRRHWLNLLIPFVFCTLVGVLLVIFFNGILLLGQKYTGELPSGARPAFLFIVALFTVLVAFVSWLMRYLNVIILTNKHMVDVSQKAFFARSVSTLELGNIEDVAIDKHGMLATLLDYGHIKIQTAGEMPNFELKYTADPETVQRTIMEAKEEFSG